MQTPYKSYFDIPEDVSYLTTPGSGLIPISSKEWRLKRDADFFQQQQICVKNRVNLISR
ncbi:hypothetical protein [Sphingobacterium sp. IITKGP-BTPF85]|uniref:hypothetical protein n=1 Tax=Sphingobacterium sp. IITKGP-BTPF85 TaxID=1338009 RepID=UPI00038A27E2|nr:hypothetical protein [Sphingobacterium sp. IITKGP-BTPF85]KKX48361.1 hypothetical protein L950_0221415 [Sphingobacterium sp. IITKGP-BTPF85]